MTPGLAGWSPGGVQIGEFSLNNSGRCWSISTRRKQISERFEAPTIHHQLFKKTEHRKRVDVDCCVSSLTSYTTIFGNSVLAACYHERGRGNNSTFGAPSPAGQFWF